jgi:hypothetical protein
MVFHRILDFKTGLDFYPGPLFFIFLPNARIAAGYAAAAPENSSLFLMELQ